MGTRDPVEAPLRVQTLGGMRVWRGKVEIEPAQWGREKALSLFQFLVTMRGRLLHREQIVDQLWPEAGPAMGERDFKVALNAINRALEPERAARAAPTFVRRHELAYTLDTEHTWVDADAFEAEIEAGNRALREARAKAAQHYARALAHYRGEYLPERRYQDWTSAERERLTVLALGTYTRLAGLTLDLDPLESLRLTQRALAIEPLWEEAYREQMRAYLALGNRGMALNTYRRCAETLEREFGVEPLPATRALYQQMQGRL